jgi:hypothetical protein
MGPDIRNMDAEIGIGRYGCAEARYLVDTQPALIRTRSATQVLLHDSCSH